MQINPDVLSCNSAPIAKVWSWVEDKSNKDILDLCQAVPSYLPAQRLRDYLSDSVREGQGSGYTQITGLDALRDDLAKDINNRYQASINASNVLISAGCNQGFCSVIDSLCQRGDDVIVALPCYFNHQMWLTMRGIGIRWLDFNEDTAIADPAQIDELITDRTKAIVLVTPNNPTGAVYPENIIHEFYLAARKHNLALIVDETYRDFLEVNQVPHKLFQEKDWQDTFIHLYSFSKGFSLAGYRLGAVVASESLIQQVCKVHDCVAICAPHITQLAAIYALNNLIQWRTDKGKEMIIRAQALFNAFENSSLDYKIITAGAYFAYVKHPFDISSESVAKQLAENFNIVCLPGSAFGHNQQQYLRFAFANLPENRFEELVRRLIISQQSIGK